MQGVYVDGCRPRSKKQVKEAVKENSATVSLEATSLFGNEYGGPVTEMPVGTKAYVVGPDPYTARNFYLTVERTQKGVKVT